MATFNTSYTFCTNDFYYTSYEWNRKYIVRAFGQALSLSKFVNLFGVTGLKRLLKYAECSMNDNCKVRISGVTVYVHFK